MAITICAAGQVVIALTGSERPSADIHRLAESITQVGLLRPLVIDESGEVVDGADRARALRLLGETSAPAIRIDGVTTNAVEASALRAAGKQTGRKVDPGASRATLDRVDKVIAFAEDITLPLPTRMAAAEGVALIAAGASANGILTRVSAVAATSHAVARYPDLAHLPDADATRMAVYLDAFDDEQRELELGVIRLTNGQEDHGRPLAMNVYTHMQDLAQAVDHERANEVAAALAAAISGHALTPALIDRCLGVADQLEQTAHGIRAAMTLERENA